MPPARARPRCRGRAPSPAGGGRGGTVGRTRGRTETRTPTAPPPRRPVGAQRAGRGKGAAERTGSYRSGDGPEADVAGRPALRAAPARTTSLPVCGPSWNLGLLPFVAARLPKGRPARSTARWDKNRVISNPSRASPMPGSPRPRRPGSPAPCGCERPSGAGPPYPALRATPYALRPTRAGPRGRDVPLGAHQGHTGALQGRDAADQDSEAKPTLGPKKTPPHPARENGGRSHTPTQSSSIK